MKAELELWGDRLVGAMFDGAYQGLALVAVIWLALKLLPKPNAATRYGVWFVTLGVVAALPLAHLFWPRQTSVVVSEAPTVEELQFAPLPTVETEPASIAPISNHWELTVPKHTSFWLIGIWAALVLMRLAYLAKQVCTLDQIKRRATWTGGPLQMSFETISRDMGLKRGARLLKSVEVDVPMVVGFFRPAVLLPGKLSAAPIGIEQLLRHELAHVARRDDWANLVQQILASIFFFNPAIWFLSRRITVEREIACDDHALTALGAARDYALFLTEFAGRPRGRDWSAAPAAWSGKSQLKERIGMILDGKRNASPRLARARVLGMTATAVLLAILALQAAPRLALAAEDIEASAPKAKPEPVVAPTPAAAPQIAVDVTSPDVNVRPVIALSGPAPLAPLTLVGLPPEPRSPRPPRAGRDDFEQRLDRLERMVESMMQRPQSGYSQDRMNQGQFKMNAPEKMAKMNPDKGGDDWGNIRDEIRREREKAMREVEHAQRDAQRAARDVARAMEDRDRAKMGAENERMNLKARREALEAQRRSLEKQIESLDKQLQSQDRDRDRDRDRNKEKDKDKDKDKEKEKNKPNSDIQPKL